MGVATRAIQALLATTLVAAAASYRESPDALGNSLATNTGLRSAKMADEPPSEPQDPVDDEVAKALAAYKRPVSAEDILSKPIKLPPPPRLFRKRRHKLRMPRKRNVTDAWWLLHHAKRTRQNVTAPIPRFNLPARTREARGDEAWANRTQRAKEREIEEHRKDKERLRRELEEERKRSRRNDAQAIDNEELRKRVMRELRELHRDQQRQLHGLYTKEWTRKEEVRDAEEETKRRQRSGQDPSLEDRYAHADACAAQSTCDACIRDPWCGWCLVSDQCVASSPGNESLFGSCTAWVHAGALPGKGDRTCPRVDYPTDEAPQGAPQSHYVPEPPGPGGYSPQQPPVEAPSDPEVSGAFPGGGVQEEAVPDDGLLDPDCRAYPGPPGDCERAKARGELPDRARLLHMSEPLYQVERLRRERLGKLEEEREKEEQHKLNRGREAALKDAADRVARGDIPGLKKKPCLRCQLFKKGVFSKDGSGSAGGSGGGSGGGAAALTGPEAIKQLYLDQMHCDTVSCMQAIDKKLNQLKLSAAAFLELDGVKCCEEMDE